MFISCNEQPKQQEALNPFYPFKTTKEDTLRWAKNRIQDSLAIEQNIQAMINQSTPVEYRRSSDRTIPDTAFLVEKRDGKGGLYMLNKDIAASMPDQAKGGKVKYFVMPKQ